MNQKHSKFRYLQVLEDNSTHLNWKENFCENDLWIQCNLTQNPSSFFESGNGQACSSILYGRRGSEDRPPHRRQDSSGHSQPDSKTTWDSIIMKKVWCEHTQIDKQTNGRKRRIHSHKHGHLIYNNCGTAVLWRMHSLLIKWGWTN